LKPAQKRLAVDFLTTGLQVSERRACHLIRIARSTQRYQSQARDDTALRIRLRDLAASRVRYGYRRLHVLLLREGWKINHKKVYRLYREMGLSLRLKRSKKRPSQVRGLVPAARRPNERWSMDFVSDSLHDGRRFRALTIVDNFTRVSPAIEVGVSITGKRVATVLDRLKILHGLPTMITVDHGPEFTSRALDEWAYRNGVKLDFTRPGKPTDNAYIESFNGKFRLECLNQNWFASLEDAQSKIEAWRRECNWERPRSSFDNHTPKVFVQSWAPPNLYPWPRWAEDPNPCQGADWGGKINLYLG